MLKNLHDSSTTKSTTPRKTIMYVVVALIIVALAVGGTFAARHFLRLKAYDDAVAAIDSVKTVAEKKDVNFSKGKDEFIDSEQGLAFFNKTGGSPDKTLFQSVSTPAEGIAKYDDAIKRLTSNRTIAENKIVAAKLDAVEKSYSKFRQHADATSKFFVILSQHTKELKESRIGKANNSSESKEDIQKIADATGKVSAAFADFKSSDQDFDAKVKKIFSDVNDLMKHVSKYYGVDTNDLASLGEAMSSMNSVLSLMSDINKESKQVNDYFNATIVCRNQLIDSLADLRATLLAEK